MIQIELLQKNSKYIGLCVSGHSPQNLGRPGENLLCAAVSILSQTLELCFINSNQLIFQKKEKGFLELKINTPNDKTEIQFNFFLTGVRALQNDAKGFITILEGEKNGT